MMRGNRLGEQTSSIAINRTTSGSAESVRARVCVTIGCSHSLIVLQTNTLNYQLSTTAFNYSTTTSAMCYVAHQTCYRHGSHIPERTAASPVDQEIKLRYHKLGEIVGFGAMHSELGCL
jgi:hypothetical protein